MSDRNDIDRERPSNWRRWGVGDESGALNLITPAKTAAAMQAVEQGMVYELGHALGRSTPTAGRRSPPLHLMARDSGFYALKSSDSTGNALRYADDYIVMACQSGTHIDALGHVWYGGSLFNDFSEQYVSTRGLERCGADSLGPIVTRGVLLDFPAFLGVPYLEPGHPIGAAELDDVTNALGLDVGSGDALLIRTGWEALNDERPGELGAGGLSVDAIPWISSRDVAVVGADNASVEAWPTGSDDLLPVHKVLLRDLGVPMVEFLHLEELAGAQIREFCFVLSPLRIQGGSGSTCNPLAIV